MRFLHIELHSKGKVMKEIVVVGAGKIGATIADLLASTGEYAVTVVDRSQAQLDALESGAEVKTQALDIEDAKALETALTGKFAVLSAAPFHPLTTRIAEAAAKAGVRYLDLTEDVASTRRVKELAKEAKTAFIPQCGLAPGFISIVAYDLAKRFDKLDSVRMRVGALPPYPSNALNYNLTWSTDGVISRYIEPCEAIVNGRLSESSCSRRTRRVLARRRYLRGNFQRLRWPPARSAATGRQSSHAQLPHHPLPGSRCADEGAPQRSRPASSP